MRAKDQSAMMSPLYLPRLFHSGFAGVTCQTFENYSLTGAAIAVSCLLRMMKVRLMEVVQVLDGRTDHATLFQFTGKVYFEVYGGHSQTADFRE